MLIRDGRIVAVGSDVEPPPGALTIDLEGFYIYPSFIDLDSEYGLSEKSPAPSWVTGQRSFSSTQQFESSGKSPLNWNDAIHLQTSAAERFTLDKSTSGEYRKAGFGTLLVHNMMEFLGALHHWFYLRMVPPRKRFFRRGWATITH